MTNEVRGQQVIAAFFEAIDSGDVAQAESLLDQLKSIAKQQTQYAEWCLYFEGVIIKERVLDWAQAERIFHNLLLNNGLDPFLRGQILLSLANSHFRQGLWSRAMRYAEDALHLFSQQQKPADQAKAWLQIALAHSKGFEQGDFGANILPEAIVNCEKALQALESIAEPTRSIVLVKCTAWNTLGLAHRALKQWNRAIECFQEFLHLATSAGNRFYTGFAYANLGEVYQRLGPEHWQEARDASLNALAIFQEYQDQYQEIEVLANLGFLYQERQEYETALDYYAQTFQAIEQIRAGTTSEETRANFFATVSDSYANAVLTCLQLNDVEQAFNYVEQARSRAFLDMLDAGSFEFDRAMTAAPLTLAAVQKALPPDALLLEYFTTGLIEAPDGHAGTEAHVDRRRFPPPKTLIFAITHDSITAYDAGISPNDLYPSDLESLVEEHFLRPAIRRALYTYLIAPFAAQLDGKEFLYIVPHGPLHYVPFQGLIAPDGETLLRPNGPQIAYAPSATILFRHSVRANPPQRKTTDIPCLAVGHNGGGNNTRLRFAEAEASAIVRLTDGEALLGESARKAKILQEAPRAQWVHFSCHGTFDPDAPLLSALHLAEGETLTAQEVLQQLQLHCQLVTLSACESGLSRVRRGDELFGLVRAFMYAGAPVLIVTQWRVDECSTRILMERFYQNLKNGFNFATALSEAQLYLKNLTRREVIDALRRFDAPDSSDPATLQEVLQKSLRNTSATQVAERLTSGDDDGPVFADPYFWAPFILIGGPGLSQADKQT